MKKTYEQPALERISFQPEQSVMNMGTSYGYGAVDGLTPVSGDDLT